MKRSHARASLPANCYPSVIGSVVCFRFSTSPVALFLAAFHGNRVRVAFCASFAGFNTAFHGPVEPRFKGKQGFPVLNDQIKIFLWQAVNSKFGWQLLINGRCRYGKNRSIVRNLWNDFPPFREIRQTFSECCNGYLSILSYTIVGWFNFYSMFSLILRSFHDLY